MTNLEALSASCNYPIDTLKLQKILIDRGLNDSVDYVGLSEALELAKADLYVLLVTSANISEGDFTVSANEKSLKKCRLSLKKSRPLLAKIQFQVWRNPERLQGLLLEYL